MNNQQIGEFFEEHAHSTAKKAVRRAAFIALASAISSFGIYLFGWRRGGGDALDTVGGLIDELDKEDTEMEEDLYN